MPETDVVPAATGRLQWKTAEVRELIDETPRVKSLVLSVPGWPRHRAGQHVDVRLTGEDGYQAQRSYSIASAPEASHLALTVERIEDGEVSPYLAGEVRPGDRFELRGPIGGHFVWTASVGGGPLFLIGGGSGVAPLMAMLRHRAAVQSVLPALLVYSSRSFEDIIFREELDRLAARGDGLAVMHTLTRKQPPGWTGGARRIDREMLAGGFPPSARPRIFVCGPTQLVESAAQSLLALGHEAGLIKTERFGPSGV